MTPLYYDRQGSPMTFEQYVALMETVDRGQDGYKRVAQTTVGPLWVSTVWLGLDHNYARIYGDEYDQRPLIFETMIFPAHDDDDDDGEPHSLQEVILIRDAQTALLHPEVQAMIETPWRYATEAEAIVGHDKICVDMRVLLANVEMADQVMRLAVERTKGPG